MRVTRSLLLPGLLAVVAGAVILVGLAAFLVGLVFVPTTENDHFSNEVGYFLLPVGGTALAGGISSLALGLGEERSLRGSLIAISLGGAAALVALLYFF